MILELLIGVTVGHIGTMLYMHRKVDNWKTRYESEHNKRVKAQEHMKCWKANHTIIAADTEARAQVVAEMWRTKYRESQAARARDMKNTMR